MTENLLNFLSTIDNLKITHRWENLPQWGGIGENNHLESVADHSWKLAILTITVINEYNLSDIDLNRAVLIANIHDLAESLTGDISTRLITQGVISKTFKEEQEKISMDKMLSSLNNDNKKFILSIWKEYESGKTKEAKLVKCLDKLDALIHFISHSDLSKDNVTGDPNHFGSYGNKYFATCPEIRELIDSIKSKMKKKYQEWDIEWKDNFNVEWKK
jgi:putative hydrolase of HD superfamily